MNQKQALARAAKNTRRLAHGKAEYRNDPPPKTARTHLAALVAALDYGDAPAIQRAREAARAFLETKT